MNSRTNPSFSKLTAIGLIALTCVLAGCGRKAGLDLPPGASAAQNSVDEDAAAANAANAASQSSAGNLSSEVYRAPGTSTIAVAPRGQKKRIPLDAILD